MVHVVIEHLNITTNCATKRITAFLALNPYIIWCLAATQGRVGSSRSHRLSNRFDTARSQECTHQILVQNGVRKGITLGLDECT